MDCYYASSLTCRDCKLKAQCTVGEVRRVRRWEHEDVLDRVEEQLQGLSDAMTIRASTVEHPFGTIKLWNGSRHFLMKTLPKVRTEMSLNVLAYNLRRMISILGVKELVKAMKEVAHCLFCVLVTRFKSLKYRFFSFASAISAEMGIATRQVSAI